jgi:TRAP-type C4-dicarboxylate transport system permease small subunit
MRMFIQLVNFVSVACAAIAAILLSGAVLIICYMVVLRASGASSYWEVEAAIYMVVAAIFLASPYTLRTGGHVAVDLWTGFLPARAARIARTGLALIGMSVCFYLAWVGWELTLHAIATDERSISMWRPPTWPLYAMLPLGMGMTALQYLADILAGFRADPTPQ